MKNHITILFLIINTFAGLGQLKPLSDQYILNPMTINPAYAGNRGALNVAAFYRQQWVGIEGAPRTLTLAADAPFFGENLGLGLIVSNDKIGVTAETSINTVYSYKIYLGDGDLSLGLGAGIITTNTAWSELTALDPGDDLYMVDSKVFVVPDFSFGVYYSINRYFAGLSIPRLLSYQFDYNRNRYGLKVDLADYYYLLNTGYIFELSERVKFFPSALLYYSPEEAPLFDINANIGYMDHFWIGASYRNNRSIGAFFQIHINEQLRLAYIYNFELGDLSRYTTGTHEIMLRYEFRYEADVVNPLVF